VGEHQRRQPRAGAEPVAAADTGLTVDRNADVVERDRVAANRALADTQFVRGCASIDDEPALQQLEERKEPGRWTRDAPDSTTTADKN
jgi:hypothetical protein